MSNHDHTASPNAHTSKHAMDVDGNSSDDDDDDLLQSKNNHNHNHNHNQHSSPSKAASKSAPPPSAQAPSSPQSQSANTENVSKHSHSKTQSEEFDVEITEEDYESIAIMIDELMKDDPAVRIKAIRSLPIISKALGEERTRMELIPYITQMIDDDDEVLLVLIEEIYRLLTLKLIGGQRTVDNQFAYCLIPPFERLCQVEEKIIRDEATLKFGKIIHDMPYKQYAFYFEQYVLPLFKRLCNCDWHTARISGATLIANAFSRFVELWNEHRENDEMEIEEQEEEEANSHHNAESNGVDKENQRKDKREQESLSQRLTRYKQEMLSLLTELCHDSIPIVRRSAIITLGKMVSVLTDKQEVLDHYLPLFKKLASDDQDNVRVFAVDTLIQFSHIFNSKEVREYLLYYIRLLALDQAWRVRYIAADNFINLCKMLDKQTIKESMVNYFIRLLQDQEAEVRAVAISKIPGISRLIGIKLSIKRLIPVISTELVSDSNKYARASLASIIIPFCYLLPHQIVIDQILSCILKILKDEYPNVRLHVISNICEDIDDGDAEEGGGASKMDQDKTDIVGAEEEEEEEEEDDNTDMDIEVEVEYEVEITVEIDENGNEIEIDAAQEEEVNGGDHRGRERKVVKRKRKRMEKQKQNMNKMKKFDISLLEESIIPSIMELTLDNDWRVRLGIIEKFPALAKQFGLKFFNQRLFALCLASLEDNVADIRLSAASNLFEISTIFNKVNKDNFQWTKEQLIPSLVQKIHSSTHYLHRLIYLLSFQYLSEGLGMDRNQDLIKEIVQFMCNDPVANVRFKACQIITLLAKHQLIHKQFVHSTLSQLQHLLQTDEDTDVRYFARQSIEALSKS